MSGSSSTIKGKALEKAVKAIESVVLKSQPELAGKLVTIRANVMLHDRGVNHEVDLVVYVDEGRPHQSIFGYECKNRKMPTDKDQVIVFAHKLKLLGATSGTIVARKFTSGARAQATHYGSLKLFTFTQNFWTGVEQLRWVATSFDIEAAKTTVHYRKQWPANHVPTTSSFCVLNSNTTTLLSLVGNIVDEHFGPIRERNELAALEGLHRRSTTVRREFTQGRCTVDGYEVEAISLEIPYLVSVRHSRLIAKFNVQGRGGHYEFVCEKDPFEGKVFSVEVTTKPV